MPTRNNEYNPGLILVGGMHGAGKTSLVDTITGHDSYARMPALSTRERRSDSDTEYGKRTRAELEAMLAAGVLVNLDEVNGEYYAASGSDIDELHDDGLTVVKEIHPDNFHKFEDRYPNTTSLIVVNRPFVTRPDRIISPRDAELTNPFVAAAMAKMALDLTDFSTIGQAASHVMHGHDLETAYVNRFPDPRKIDADNQNTYSAVAPVFVDTLRLTTRDFHEASVGPLTRIVSSMPAGSQVLELGAGSNWLQQSVDLSHLNMTHQESAEAMHSLYSEGDNRILSPIRKLPIKTGELDYVVGSLVDGMMYPQALLEMQRVLRQDGRIVLTYPSREWAVSTRDGAKKASFNNDGAVQQAHSFSPTRDELDGLLKDVGFTLEEYIACPAAEREKEYYSPALFDQQGELPASVATIIIARKDNSRE